MGEERKEQERQELFEEGAMAVLLEKDYTRAMERFRQAAELGHPLAAHNIGVLYENGTGVQVDMAEALKWYEMAADLGDADAQYRCAKMYLNGEGTEKNSAIYLMWLRKAAAQGHTEAAEMWGRLSGSEELVAAALLEDGKWAFKKKRYEEAMERFLEVPKPNRAAADYILGLMFEEGLGTEAAKAKALASYEKAAEQGHVEAMFRLGEIYDDDYHEEAGKKGHEAVKKRADKREPFPLVSVYMNAAVGPEWMLERALMWYEKAAGQGHVEAQIKCGMMYFWGNGTEKNYEKAVMWLEKAKAQGATKAHWYLKGVRAKMEEEAEASKNTRRKKGLFGLF